MSEDVVPGRGVLRPKPSAQAEQQARGQVEEGWCGRQHPLHCPDELLGLHGGRGGEEADALAVEDVAAGCRHESSAQRTYLISTYMRKDFILPKQ